MCLAVRADAVGCRINVYNSLWLRETLSASQGSEQACQCHSQGNSAIVIAALATLMFGISQLALPIGVAGSDVTGEAGVRQ